MIIDFDNSIESYETFLRVKSLPTYRIFGHSAEFPDEFSEMMGFGEKKVKQVECSLSDKLFDYQTDITKLAIKKRKFAVFADCGLGKTLILLEFARHCRSLFNRGKVLIVSPLMVVHQTSAESEKFYGEPLERIPANRLNQWLHSSGPGIGITNYDAMRDDITQGNLKTLILDESSMLKSAYGKYGNKCIELGKGLDYKLALSGTPAPNDRIEYANHAVFLDIHKTVNEFLARYFVNKAQTQERWIIKPHALIPFYQSMSQWCIFLTDPSVYGWKDNAGTIPPIHVHIDKVPLTKEQQSLVQKSFGAFFVTKPGGIAERSRLSQIAKGKGGIPTNKPQFIKDLVDSWPDESTLIWCHYNDEQDTIDKIFPEAESIRGKTPLNQRLAAIDRFKKGITKVLISKPKILGFGLNLQVATRQVFSGLMDSYESFYQAVKRSNRVGSTRPLNVHIPITDVEEPMIQTVLDKAHRVQSDAEIQERMFKKHGYDFFK